MENLISQNLYNNTNVQPPVNQNPQQMRQGNQLNIPVNNKNTPQQNNTRK